MAQATGHHCGMKAQVFFFQHLVIRANSAQMKNVCIGHATMLPFSKFKNETAHLFGEQPEQLNHSRCIFM